MASSTSRPEAAYASFRSRLDAKVELLEARIEAALDQADDASVSAEEGENMHQLLGAHRGASEALIEFARQAGDVDWATLREERF